MKRLILATCAALLVLAPVLALAQNRTPPAGSSTVGSAAPRGDSGGSSSSSGGSDRGSGSGSAGMSSGGTGGGGSYASPVGGSSMRGYDGPRSGEATASARPRGGGPNVGQAVPVSERPRGDRPAIGQATARVSRPSSGGVPDIYRNGYDYYGNNGYYGYGYYGNFYNSYGYGYPYWYGQYSWMYDPYGWNYWPSAAWMGPFAMSRYASYWYAYDYGATMGAAYTSNTQGSVKLKVTPKEAEVYVDGTFYGQVDRYDGAFQSLELRSGTHKIEIRAAGYETIQVEVRILPGRTVTYRSEMKAVKK